MQTQTEQEKHAVSWAFAIINSAAKEFCPRVLKVEKSSGRFEWDIETPSGWVAINTLGELCEFARSLQKPTTAKKIREQTKNLFA